MARPCIGEAACDGQQQIFLSKGARVWVLQSGGLWYEGIVAKLSLDDVSILYIDGGVPCLKRVTMSSARTSIRYLNGEPVQIGWGSPADDSTQPTTSADGMEATSVGGSMPTPEMPCVHRRLADLEDTDGSHWLACRSAGVGLGVRVYSASAGACVDATSVACGKGQLKVVYLLDGLLHMKRVSSKVAASNFAPVALGSQVLVPSVSGGKLVQAVVTDAFRDRLRVQYFRSGRSYAKTVDLLDVHFVGGTP